MYWVTCEHIALERTIKLQFNLELILMSVCHKLFYGFHAVWIKKWKLIILRTAIYFALLISLIQKLVMLTFSVDVNHLTVISLENFSAL